MHKIFSVLFILSMSLLVSCSRKTLPAKPAATVDYDYDSSARKPETKPMVVVKKSVVKKNNTPTYPKVISVNDAAAKRSIDGRLYYDVEGHRYWKNFKDGKYYLFDKSMYKNPDFNPPR